MANKRMFTKKITDSDAFLNMPLSTQALYFHLSMHADDDGFVGSPSRIAMMIGANKDDLNILKARRFVLEFAPDGIIVIKHWRMHNTISRSRYYPTQYTEEKAMLYLKDNDAYTLDNTQGIPLDDRKYIEKNQREQGNLSAAALLPDEAPNDPLDGSMNPPDDAEQPAAAPETPAAAPLPQPELDDDFIPDF